VIVPIYKSDEERATVAEATRRLVAGLHGVRVKVDDRDGFRPGYKYNEWELKGVPIRLEVGTKDVAAGQVMLARRDNGNKMPVPEAGVADVVAKTLEEIQRSLYEQAAEFRDEHTFAPADYAEFKRLLEDPGGFLEARWCGDRACEDRVKADTQATIRYLPLDPVDPSGNCLICGRPAKELAAWAVAY